MKHARIVLTGAAIVTVALVVLVVFGNIAKDEADAPHTATPRPVMSVAVTRGRTSMLPIRIPASGNVAAWQEASVGAESGGLRLTGIEVDVGDTVRRGQVLAVFNVDIVEAELAEARASVSQVAAEVMEAEANAHRAKSLERSGAMSAQQIDQYVVSAITARARMDAARAAEKKARLRLSQARVLAPSDGIVTSRTATIGAVVPAGEELFRLIKDGRLEWRATVATSDIETLAPGQIAEIGIHGHAPIRGKLRMVGPTIDTDTHSGLVYVDLPRGNGIRAGAFARGHFEVGNGSALTLPQSAVLLRDGFNYIMLVGPKSNVVMKKVSVGRRIDDRIEIKAGLSASETVIASGVGFLSDGDTVRVVDDPTRDGAHARAAPNPAASLAKSPAKSPAGSGARAMVGSE